MFQFWEWRFIFFFFWKFKILKIISIFDQFLYFLFWLWLISNNWILDVVEVDLCTWNLSVKGSDIFNYKRYQIKSICAKTIDSLFCYCQLLTIDDVYNYRTTVTTVNQWRLVTRWWISSISRSLLPNIKNSNEMHWRFIRNQFYNRIIKKN